MEGKSEKTITITKTKNSLRDTQIRIDASLSNFFISARA